MNKSILNTTHDIPFPEARIMIRNPRLEEIFLIGENAFHQGCRLLTVSKDLLNSEDKNNLESITDFDIFMSIVFSKESIGQKKYILSILQILFPNYQISFDKEKGVKFAQNGRADTFIDKTNYNSFKDIIIEMFSINNTEHQYGGYNPANKAAAAIAEKFKKAKQKIKPEEEHKDINIFGNYIAILSVGECKDWNSFLGYTPYQIKTEFEKYMAKQRYDMYIDLKLAGAEDLDEVDNWMVDNHS